MFIRAFIRMVFLALSLIVAPGLISEDQPDPGIKTGRDISFALFKEDKPIETTLVFDLTSYIRNKPKDGYIKASITFHLSDKDSISRDIRLKTRGIFRKSYCYYPPIELNFKKVDFGFTDLDKISKLKMVIPCKAGIANEKYILKEYLVYKLYSVLTDTSFRVRLLKLTCVDSEKKKKSYQQYSFLIEPVEMLTARTNSVQIKSKALNQTHITPRLMDRLAIFNYMIGNYDWSIPGQHNIKVIKPLVIDSAQNGIAVPYDFDWTGVVDASYAVPAEFMGIDNVRQRLFQGVCRDREVYENDLQEFIAGKDEFYRVINDFEYLGERDKKDVTNYLNEFFDNITGKNSVVDIFLRSCKKL
ncbi:MAG TPA: hypothetical protein VJ963_07845 [Bacteroidales bacterium]|nr:hypothetical protein [Bacteroidales bacterium]